MRLETGTTVLATSAVVEFVRRAAIAGGSAASALWSFGSLDDGQQYELFAHWPRGIVDATMSVDFELHENTTLVDTVAVDQSALHVDAVLDGRGGRTDR